MIQLVKPILLIIIVFLAYTTPGLAQQFQFNALTSEDGLSHNTVFSIAQDYKGFMWFGTRDGLSRYDSQRIKNYYFDVHSPNVEASRINCIYAVDQALWVGTPVGLFRYDFAKDTVVRLPLGKAHVSVSSIRRASTGALWVSSQDGIYILKSAEKVRHILPQQDIHALCEFRKGAFIVLQGDTPRLVNAEGETLLTLAIDEAGREKSPTFRDYTLYKDRQGVIWLGTNGGLLQLDEQTMTFRPADWFSRLIGSRVRVIRTLTEDRAGNLWVGSESGVMVVDKQRQSVQQYDQSFATSPNSLTDRSVYSSFVSRDGTVWVGTYFGGVNYAKPIGISFNNLFPAVSGQGLSGKAVSQLVEDDRQRIWMGTEDGGVTIQDPATGRYTYHNRSNGLSDNNVHALWLDKSGVAWVGTFLGGLNRIDPTTGRKTTYTHNPANPASISNNSVYALHRDRNGTLWVGTQRGLNILDEKTGTFRLFRPDALATKFIYAIQSDAAGQVWIATRASGIYQYDPGPQKLLHYTAVNTPTMRSNQIISIYEDSRHNRWFGSLDGGVCGWNYALKRFVANPVNAHLPSQTVYGILEDNGGTYWFSTNRGLLSYYPAQKTARIFDKSSGLSVTQFNFKSFLKDGRGWLYFGSVDGLCYFDPAVITKRVFDPPVYFTDLKLFNKVVKANGETSPGETSPGEASPGEVSVLTHDIDETSELVLAHAQNVITLDFVAINYFSKGTSQYTYYLEGFEDTWNPKTTVNSRTYTNLSPGKYTFHVRSIRSDGTLSASERRINLIIKPPFWQSGYAWFIYLLMGLCVLLLYRRFSRFLNRQKMAVQIERVEREKSEELNRQKLNFFTFLSNEFKTPITLILAEIDELIQARSARRTDSIPDYDVIRKNAKRLQSLIDQITELRKTQGEPQKIDLTHQDIVGFVKETVQVFDPLLQARHIRRNLRFSTPYLMASFDTGKLEMIIGNVLFFLANELNPDEELTLDVAVENQPGLPDCRLRLNFSLPNHPDVFQHLKQSYQLAQSNQEVFQQSDSVSIGILLTFSLLNLLSGAVNFTQEADGPVFSLRLPMQKSPLSKIPDRPKNTAALSRHILNPVADVPTDGEPPGALPETAPAADKLTMLIIDQSKDLAQFLKRHFGGKYRIVLAHTVEEALKKAETTLPDVVLCASDIRNRANQNLCVVLKNNPKTQTIPVILLLNDQDDKTILDGLHSGADGYVSKPFNLNELDLLVANHLKSVRVLKNKLAGSLTGAGPTTLPQRNKEQEFVLRFSALVHQRYQDKNLSADELARQMNCSRSQLHVKLKKFTGLSTKEYLNDYRLSVARQRLAEGAGVADVTFEVGFSDPNYFGRAFKKRFGITPGKVGSG